MRFTILLLTISLFTCREKYSSTEKTNSIQSGYIQYATGFTVKNVNGIKLIEVLNPYLGATAVHKYMLVPRGTQAPQADEDTRIIHVPIQTIVCTSTTHIPLLDYLGETSALVGFPTLDYISSVQARRRIDEGGIQELGVDKGMNLELLAMLKPDVVMSYTMSADMGQFRKIEDLGMPVVVNAEYLEKHPLGRAEWIKFMALFFNKERLADSIFRDIEKSYLNTCALTKTVTAKPTVLSGILYRDAWFLPGGQNYAAQLFRDAGFRYLWEDDLTHGFLELSFESVYARAHNADFWIGVASFTSLQEMAIADSRYVKFKPFKDRNVFTYNARKGAKGGSEFMEIGYLRPDIILSDLVKIAHPELKPYHDLYFHAAVK